MSSRDFQDLQGQEKGGWWDWKPAKLALEYYYTIECYVPEPKRKFGYFVCPLLRKNQLVARIDMKADRKSGTLQVKKIHHEPILKDRGGFDRALSQSLDEFARFNGCSKVEGI